MLPQEAYALCALEGQIVFEFTPHPSGPLIFAGEGRFFLAGCVMLMKWRPAISMIVINVQSKCEDFRLDITIVERPLSRNHRGGSRAGNSKLIALGSENYSRVVIRNKVMVVQSDSRILDQTNVYHRASYPVLDCEK